MQSRKMLRKQWRNRRGQSAPETSDREIPADLPGRMKKEALKKGGKGGNGGNLKWKEGKVQNEERTGKITLPPQKKNPVTPLLENLFKVTFFNTLYIKQLMKTPELRIKTGRLASVCM